MASQNQKCHLRGIKQAPRPFPRDIRGVNISRELVHLSQGIVLNTRNYAARPFFLLLSSHLQNFLPCQTSSLSYGFGPAFDRGNTF